jgi:hypothetical protein
VIIPGGSAFDHLYLGSLRGKWRPRPIYTAPSRKINIAEIQISPRWIAWANNTTVPSEPWTILALDRATGKLYTVDSSASEGLPPTEIAFPVISLYGSTLAWSYSHCTARCNSANPTIASSVATRSLPAGKRHIITSTYGRCGSLWPSIWGRTVVWFQEGVCQGHHGNDVMMYDVATGRIRQLTHDHKSSMGVTNGRYVAWKYPGDRFQVNVTFMLLDLKTGRRRPASLVLGRWTPGCRTGNVDTCAFGNSPVLTSRLLVWGTEGPQAPDETVMALDLRRDKQYRLSLDNQVWYGSDPGPGSGLRAVWIECHDRIPANGHCLWMGATALVP